MNITVTCPQCGKQFSREFDTTKVNRVAFGELVQNVFPELSSEERELYFISHICSTCWDNMFKEEDIDAMVEQHYELLNEIENGR